jgi:hypothetical protein
LWQATTPWLLRVSACSWQAYKPAHCCCCAGVSCDVRHICVTDSMLQPQMYQALLPPGGMLLRILKDCNLPLLPSCPLQQHPRNLKTTDVSYCGYGVCCRQPASARCDSCACHGCTSPASRVAALAHGATALQHCERQLLGRLPAASCAMHMPMQCLLTRVPIGWAAHGHRGQGLAASAGLLCGRLKCLLTHYPCPPLPPCFCNAVAQVAPQTGVIQPSRCIALNNSRRRAIPHTQLVRTACKCTT